NARFGITVQFPKSFSIKEKFEVDGSSTFADRVVYLDRDQYADKVQYDIISPFELGAGFSVNLMGLIVSAEGTLIDYTQIEFDDPEGLSEQYIAGINKNIKDNLTTVLNYNLGVEYTIPNIGLRLRGGFFVQPSAYKDDPADFDKKYLTAGIGFLTEGTIGIDLGFAHGWWKDIGDNYGSNISRTFQDIRFNKVILTTTYRF